MNEFLSTVQTSIEKAQAATQKKREIAEVLKSVSSAVNAATDGVVSVIKAEAVGGFTEGLLKSLALFLKDSKKQTVLLLRHSGHPKINDIQIAIWKEDALGYPCTLAFGNEEHLCPTKAALVTAFKCLLADPHIGMAIESQRKKRVESPPQVLIQAKNESDIKEAELTPAAQGLALPLPEKSVGSSRSAAARGITSKPPAAGSAAQKGIKSAQVKGPNTTKDKAPARSVKK